MRVPGDHVRFSEVVQAYCSGSQYDAEVDTTFVLAPLEITKPIITSRFEVRPGMRVAFAGARVAFVQPIDLPDKVDSITAHLMAHAVSALLSVAFLRAFNAPRDPYHIWAGRQPAEKELAALAVQHNVLAAGVGSETVTLADADEVKYGRALQRLVDGLEALGLDLRARVLQAIRLQQLGLLTKRTDFELGFSLIVASMEAMSQIALSIGDDIPLTPVELRLKTFCSADPELTKWFQQKVIVQGKLVKRFVEYVLRFAPPESWPEAVAHPLAEITAYATELTGENQDWVTGKSWWERYPEDLSRSEIKKILQSTYSDRSLFVHSGLPSHHSAPTSCNRFFDEAYLFDPQTGKRTKSVALRFEALAGVARLALLNYLSSLQDAGASKEPSTDGGGPIS